VRLNWQGYRGLRYELQTTTSLANWPAGSLQTFSGTDAELSYDAPVSGSASFFRLLISEEP